MKDFGFEIKLKTNFDEAINMLTFALKDEGFGVLTEIDVKDTLKKKIDVEFRKYKIIGACNPTLAYKALSNRPEIGILLPCNATVEEDGKGGSIIRLLDPKIMIGFGGLAKDKTISTVADDAHKRMKRIEARLNEMT